MSLSAVLYKGWMVRVGPVDDIGQVTSPTVWK